MKKAIQNLSAGLKSLRTRCSTAALSASVALSLSVASLPSWAELPKMEAPEAIGGGKVADGDFIGLFGAYWKAIIAIIVLIIAGIAFIRVATGALSKWSEYTKGRADQTDLKEFLVTGFVLLAVIVLLLTYAVNVFNT